MQSPLLPSEHDALAVGLDAALGGPIGGGAYDLAQKCDVEIWVAAAALRAVGGDADSEALLMVGEGDVSASRCRASELGPGVASTPFPTCSSSSIISLTPAPLTGRLSAPSSSCTIARGPPHGPEDRSLGEERVSQPALLP